MAGEVKKGKENRVSNNFMEINYGPKTSSDGEVLKEEDSVPSRHGSASNHLNQDPEKPQSRRCATIRQCFAGCCRPCLWRHHPLPAEPSVMQKISYALMCPPHGKLARLLTLVVIVFFMWGVLWGVTGDQALPGGNLFALLVLIVSCTVGGFLVSKIRLPPLLGEWLNQI